MPDTPPFVPTAVLMIALCGGVALAHSGVANPVVKARMDLMVQVKDATVGLGRMAQGAVAFDAEQLGFAARAMQTASHKDGQVEMRAVAKACAGCHESFRIDR